MTVSIIAFKFIALCTRGPPDNYTDPYNQVSSQANVPLVANVSPFQRGYAPYAWTPPRQLQDPYKPSRH
ncbi:hypothetical protein JVT61DRAFT_12061 [Boletus reticuloceps]|uniref:Uncharacterized protein n=1 Tax=Boletus reticuloceps TaxID=495285 RepID=A0A8I2YEI5_9AGAM|nr:hypothetical protein JVT61DRAFT_12061 [Boletus reticuloceps]